MTLSRVCPGVPMTQVVELQNRHSRYWYPLYQVHTEAGDDETTAKHNKGTS